MSPSTLFWVFVAGGLGASLRFVLAARVDQVLATRLGGIGTLLVNLLGCLLIGLFSQVLAKGPIKTAVLTGLLGGFTTYSAFALMTLEMWTNGRHGTFAIQVCVHLIGGLICAGLGVWIGRLVAGTP